MKSQKKQNQVPNRKNKSPKSNPQQNANLHQASFSHIIESLFTKSDLQGKNRISSSDSLAHLSYSRELEIKNRALEIFWERFQLAKNPEKVVPSPQPRNYRTTSKRRVLVQGGKPHLVMGDRKQPYCKNTFQESALEPTSHSSIYKFLQSSLAKSPFDIIVKYINYLIIRGNYQEQAVIFNINEINGPLIRKLKTLGKKLREQIPSTSATFAYLDPSGSDYYLEQRPPANVVQLKKLWGKDKLELRLENRRFIYHPTSFSQVNESMLPVMLDKIQELLAPKPQERLLDLYCGYGLFSHYFTPCYKQTLGIEAAAASVQDAIFNKKFNPHSRKTKFISGRINKNNIEHLLPIPWSRTETILLDPPRQGPDKGVIPALYNRSPGKVLHIHCNMEQLPASFREWQKGGYRVRRILPLDMFAGTTNLEVLVLFDN